MKPSYKTHDPKGWCGDPRRGAAMGRPAIHSDEEGSYKLHLQQIRLDSGGYDVNGTYFGFDPENILYWCASTCGSLDFVIRARSRKSAKWKINLTYPKATFFR